MFLEIPLAELVKSDPPGLWPGLTSEPPGLPLWAEPGLESDPPGLFPGLESDPPGLFSGLKSDPSGKVQ